jgi:formate-dependent nitrite reductase cytochrome c552 subunit
MCSQCHDTAHPEIREEKAAAAAAAALAAQKAKKLRDSGVSPMRRRFQKAVRVVRCMLRFQVRLAL